MNQDERLELLRSRITESFQPQTLDIVDESHRHAGHASAKGGGHFLVSIVSSSFAGKSLIERHRMVHKLFDDVLGGEIHALSIRAKAPEEVEAAT